MAVVVSTANKAPTVRDEKGVGLRFSWRSSGFNLERKLLALYTVVTDGADDVVSVDSGVYRNGQQGWT